MKPIVDSSSPLRAADSAYHLRCGRHALDLSFPRVMGILNVTPDSFSDGGQHIGLDSALHRAEQMLAEGAAMIDVGGESTRPGASPVSEQEELDRVAPVVEALVHELDALVSVDTSSPAVMREVSALGAGMINDVRALEREGALGAAASTGLPVCLMHRQGEPQDMQQSPYYGQPVERVVADYLAERIAACEAAGIRRSRLLVDPGFGFGKTIEHNLRLLKYMDELQALELPLLVGMSRKSMIGKVLGRPVEERLAGGLALAAMAVERGANILRVHDVGPTVDAVNMAWAVLQEGGELPLNKEMTP
ncbi:dihydropteroate synthase [Vreelandella venusta]|uniref:dihydropteroate synthase n=1 Tax=Vreelandella venusta TaxID=44935 RepID=UPI00197AE3E6|nr:dihydropteroate synthase [Halomonas venusta]MDX1354437.1 dihydropteroate synthase [Halomonas venusta]MDX1713599.1 dihydropteroate synthase [Halomonas venusta]WAM48920.1 dihydropteroate synthase [Halomonas venusta]